MSISISISGQMDNITTTIFQNTADQMFTGVIGLTALNYKNNVGHLMLALLSALGFVCSDDGKTLSHSSNPTAKLNWCKPASKASGKSQRWTPHHRELDRRWVEKVDEATTTKWHVKHGPTERRHASQSDASNLD